MDRNKTMTLKRWIVLILGWIFVALGILGLFLPVLQGVLFLTIGLLLLSTEYAWAGRLIAKISRKYPRVGGLLERATEYVDRLIQKIHNLGSRKSSTEK